MATPLRAPPCQTTGAQCRCKHQPGRTSMASNDDNADNADNARTSAGAGPGDETLLVPPPKEADPELAWSLDADDDTVPVERQSWGLAWGQAAVVLSTAAVVAFVIAVVGWT